LGVEVVVHSKKRSLKKALSDSKRKYKYIFVFFALFCMDIDRAKCPSQFRQAFDKLGFERLPDRDLSTLATLNYYVGPPCPHGHLIRQKEKHWCYDCAIKIMSNVCSYNINHLEKDYNSDALHIFGSRGHQPGLVTPGDWDECWEAPQTRIRAISWRSDGTRKREMVRIQKVVYGFCWGDVGSASVTMICGNKNCVNPLHMRSSFNLCSPPDRLQEFVDRLDWNQMLIGNEMIAEYKAAITNPKDLQDLE
jgi:hypothetical protein